MSKRRSRNAARLGGSASRPPSLAEQRRTSAQLQSERYRLGIATPDDDKSKKKPKASKKATPASEAKPKRVTSRKPGNAPSNPSKGQRVLVASASAPMKQQAADTRDSQSGSLDWKTAVVSVLGSGDSLTVGEISERIYSNGFSKALAQQGLLEGNAYESIREAIAEANDGGTAITRWRDPHDAAIRYTLGTKKPKQPARHQSASRTHPGPDASRRSRAPGSPRTLLDAAEQVLRHHADRRPLHIRDVVSLAVEHGYWSTGGRTPTNTLSARVGVEIKQRQADGQRQRFTRPWRGYLGLAAWEISVPTHVAETDISEVANEPSSGVVDEDTLEPDDVVGTVTEEVVPKAESVEIDAVATREDPESERQPAAEVDDSSDPGVVSALAGFLTTLKPKDFIRCLTAYLAAIGAEDLTFGNSAGCFDISAKGELVAAGLFRRPLIVHVSSSIEYCVTQSDIAVCRGQAGTYDLALVIALGGFSPEARTEVRRSGVLPVVALDRPGFAQALFDLEIGVRIERVDSYEVGLYF